MQPAARPAVLTTSQTGCLNAVKDGVQTRMMIAIKAKRDLKTAAAALEKLRRAQLIRRSGGRGWQVTERGQSCAVETIADPGQRLGGRAARHRAGPSPKCRSRPGPALPGPAP